MEIYKIENKEDGKVYIGLTIQGYKKRYRKHLSDARNRCEFYLHRAIAKYGPESFELTLIESCNDMSELKERESFWISHYSSNDRDKGYNLTEGGDGTVGKRHSEETKAKIRGAALNGTSVNDVITVVFINGVEKECRGFEETSKVSGVSKSTISQYLRKKGDYIRRDSLTILRLENKGCPKPRKTKRTPEQISAHMKMMQDKSVEARTENREELRAKRMATDIENGRVNKIQMFSLEGEFEIEFWGEREVERQTGKYGRAGIRSAFNKKKPDDSGFVKYKDKLWKRF